MNLESQLKDLVCSESRVDMSISQLFDFVLHFTHSSANSSFMPLLAERHKQRILQTFPHLSDSNLATIFSHSSDIDHESLSLTELSETERSIERLALTHFQHWLEFWCELEIYQIKARYKDASVVYLNNQKVSYNDEDYHCELIANIAECEQRYMTLHFETPMQLSDAVALINLELFVRGESWFEMLSCLDLSRQGQHLVITQKAEPSLPPLLVCTGLIQDWQVRHHWLSYDKPFQSKPWNMCWSPYANECFKTDELVVQLPTVTCETASEFDQMFARSLVKPERICEFLRLTVSGTSQQKLYYLYLGQKLSAQRLCEHGYAIALTIIEQPFILDYYRVIDEAAYTTLCYCDINHDGVITYRGFWNVKNMHAEMKKLDFRSYKKLVKQSRLQQAREGLADA